MVAASRAKSSDRAAILKKLLPAIKKQYKVVVPKHDRPVLETMLFAICLEDVSVDEAETAFTRLGKEFPDLNASLIEEGGQMKEIVYKKYYNIGMAVDTEDGLTVPVIKDVDCKGIWELSRDIVELGEKARQKKLGVSDLQEGTFTISNAGNIGGLFAPPIINYPEVAIMGVHQIKKRPMVVGNEIKIRDIIYLSLSLDHRVVDGAVAARFMNRVVGLLQDPKMLMMEMMGPAF